MLKPDINSRDIMLAVSQSLGMFENLCGTMINSIINKKVTIISKCKPRWQKQLGAGAVPAGHPSPNSISGPSACASGVGE